MILLLTALHSDTVNRDSSAGDGASDRVMSLGIQTARMKPLSNQKKWMRMKSTILNEKYVNYWNISSKTRNRNVRAKHGKG